MSFVAAATAIGFTGVGATIAAGAMMGGATTVAGNVIGGRDPFDNIGRGLITGGITGGLTPGFSEMTGFSVPASAGLIQGGLTALATGDIGQGLMAGATAYGMYGLTNAGQQMGLAEALSGTTTGGEQVFGDISAADASLPSDGSAGQAFNKYLTNPTATGAATQANATGNFFKDNFKYLAAAAGPILADQAVKSKGPQTVTQPGMIRPYSYDPYSGAYTAGNPYEVTPTKAAGGGLMGLAAGGMAGYEDDEEGMATGGMGGMFNFAQQSEPVVRMAEGGGIVALAGGGDYTTLTKDSSADAIASAYKQAVAASGGDTAANQKVAIDYLTNLGIGQDKIGQAYGTYQASPTYTQYTPEQMGSFFSNPVNKDINLDKAIIDANANPADVNRYIASFSSPFVGSTDTTGGSGTLGIYNRMVAEGIDANEAYAALIANDPKYAGWSKEDITRGYNLDKGAYALSKELGGNVSDKDWVKFMDANKYSINDAAQAFGLSRNEVKRRYDAVKAAEKVVTKDTVTGGGGNDTIVGGTTKTTPITYNTDGTNAPGSLESVLGLPPGVSGAGTTVVNPNGTITTRPDLSLGMKTVRDDYVRGGGSLGYTSPTYTPEEFQTKYVNKLTGGSKQSFDYLTGKTPYSATPATATGEIMKPYSSSVLGIPMASSKRMYLFDPATKTYKINPDYAIPTYDSKGKKSLNLTNQDVINYVKSPEYSNDDTFVSWMTDNNLSPEQVAAATGMSIADVYKKIKKAKPVDVDKVVDASVDSSSTGGTAAGGLMKLARGGMSQQFDLGGYSDGGRLLRGPGDGVSDSIPATIGNKRPARLADGEFVVPARIVSELGNGSTEAGARKLYAMMDRVQKARRGTVGKGRVAKNSRSDKYLPA